MCGITGIYNFNLNLQPDIAVLKKMTDSIQHRGPDGEGFYMSKNVGLGHRRLSIIDMNTGDQPMFSIDKKIVIVFNGEIYNYIELREELKQLGYEFISSSDTEVIINSYLEWGFECQNKFNGMWAFAIWDERKQLLFISRDRTGQKPLHYAIYKNIFVFGSEIISLLKYGIPDDKNMEMIEIYLALGYIPSPHSFYKQIHKLKPGHYLVVTHDGCKEIKYWDLPDIDEKNMIKDRSYVYDQFEQLFEDAVRLRMRSDVPFGAFLSGGLDSSSVVSKMAEISNFPVKTFTIGYHEKEFDERKLAKLVADQYNTEHHEILIEQDTLSESVSKVYRNFDEPFGDSSAIPTGYVSKFASKHVKMVLTGDGGDELLSGYTIYQGEKFSSNYKKFPSFIGHTIPGFVKSISPLFKGNLRYKLNRVYNVTRSANEDFIERCKSKLFWLDKYKLNQLLSYKEVYPIQDYLHDFFKQYNVKDGFYKLMYFNYKISLPEDMLVKVDRMSMAYSLEARQPFLDHRLIELMMNVSKGIKMEKYQRKSVLINTIGQRLPKPLLQASKKGFGIPLREWFSEYNFDDMTDNLLKNRVVSDKVFLNQVIESNNSCQVDLGNFLWMLLILNNYLK